MKKAGACMDVLRRRLLVLMLSESRTFTLSAMDTALKSGIVLSSVLVEVYTLEFDYHETLLGLVEKLAYGQFCIAVVFLLH